MPKLIELSFVLLSVKKNSIQLTLLAISGLGLLCYIIYKAYSLSFTHDESYTYLHYVHQGFMDIISYKTPYTNNHILNTVLMKYSEVLFGSSEIALRLPNIIAFIIYSLFATLLLYRQCPKLIFSFYLLLTLNSYLLDFFSLARGYGLSICFLIMSIYYLSSYFISKQNRHLILFNVAAFLAVMSNFSLLNYYAAALIVYNVIHYINIKSNDLDKESGFHFYRLNKINIISVLISGMVLYEPLRRISKMGMLDFGGKIGFLTNTVGSSVDDLFYEMHVTEIYVVILKGLILIVPFVALILIITKFIKKRNLFFKENITLLVVNLTLLIIVVITLIQHVVLGNDFYEHRFALFFYPLFMLNFIFLINYFSKLCFIWTGITISSLCSILLMTNLYINHNLVYFKDWKYDQDTKQVMKQLIVEHNKYPDRQIRLGISWLLEPGTNFYRYTWSLEWLNPTHRRGINKSDDYFFLLVEEKQVPLAANKEIIYSNSKSGSVLVKNLK